MNDLIRQIEELYAQLDLLRMNKQALVDGVLTDEVKNQLKEIDDEFDPVIVNIQDTLKVLEDKVKKEVAELGYTVKGNLINVVWQPGRVTWNTKELDKLLKEIPTLQAYRKEGEPFATIQPVKKGKSNE